MRPQPERAAARRVFPSVGMVDGMMPNRGHERQCGTKGFSRFAFVITASAPRALISRGREGRGTLVRRVAGVTV
jgi:hypothetical protein